VRPVVRVGGLMVAAFVLMFVGSGIAQASTALAAHAGSGSRLSAQDRAFLVQAHQSNLAEIATGKLAERKATRADVRALGRMFVADHRKLDAELRVVAKKLEVRLPSQPNRQQRAAAAKLERLSGRAFDKAWLDVQIVAHRQAIAAGAKEIAHGTNSDVVRLAKKSAPVIKHHLRELLRAKARPASTKHNKAA
jgi:putative membrane protein